MSARPEELHTYNTQLQPQPMEDGRVPLSERLHDDRGMVTLGAMRAIGTAAVFVAVSGTAALVGAETADMGKTTISAEGAVQDAALSNLRIDQVICPVTYDAAASTTVTVTTRFGNLGPISKAFPAELTYNYNAPETDNTGKPKMDVIAQVRVCTGGPEDIPLTVNPAASRYKGGSAESNPDPVIVAQVGSGVLRTEIEPMVVIDPNILHESRDTKVAQLWSSWEALKADPERPSVERIRNSAGGYAQGLSLKYIQERCTPEVEKAQIFRDVFADSLTDMIVTNFNMNNPTAEPITELDVKVVMAEDVLSGNAAIEEDSKKFEEELLSAQAYMKGEGSELNFSASPKDVGCDVASLGSQTKVDLDETLKVRGKQVGIDP